MLFGKLYMILKWLQKEEEKDQDLVHIFKTVKIKMKKSLKKEENQIK